MPIVDNCGRFINVVAKADVMVISRYFVPFWGIFHIAPHLVV